MHIMKTEFTDKFGKPLYVGDIVRYYLSDIGPGGPDKKGWVLRHTHGQYLALVDTQYREQNSFMQ